MKKNKYEDLSNQIMDLVGGKDNVSFMTHCMTRLRLNVKDKGLVNVDKIEEFDCVIGTQWTGDQIQIIIGQSVPDLYNLINKKTGLGEGEVNEDGTNKKKKFTISMIFDAISGCVIPCLPILIGAGFIKVIVVLCELAGLLSVGEATHTVLTFVGDAGFYFLPIFIGSTAAKKFGANPALGMLIGAFLIHPTFIQSVADGTKLSIFGLPITGVSYTSTIFPVLMSVAIMAPIERFIAKHSPDILRVMLEPLLTILIMLPIVFCVIGPLGSFLGTYLSEAVIWLYETTGFVGISVLAALYPLLVMTGMHTAFIPYAVNAFATTGFEAFFSPGAIIASVQQGVACLAVALKTKKQNVRATGLTCSITALLSGVFEPALYGITLKYKTPLYASMIGSLCGGLVAGLGKAIAVTMVGTTGLLALPAFITDDIANLLWMIAGIVVATITTFILTYIFYKEESEVE